MELVHWTETSYANAGHRAWACRAGNGDVLFYLVGREPEWHVRNSLGKGYRAGSWAPTHGVGFRARGLEVAKERALVKLADALLQEAGVLRRRSDYLVGAARRAS